MGCPGGNEEEMSVKYEFEQRVIREKSKVSKPGTRITIRRQECESCRKLFGENKATVLAYEFTENPGFGGEYYVITGGLWVKGEFHPTYKRGRWFGNYVVCPVCKNTGRLPMDKPLNWDAMMISRGGKNASN